MLNVLIALLIALLLILILIALIGKRKEQGSIDKRKHLEAQRHQEALARIYTKAHDKAYLQSVLDRYNRRQQELRRGRC